MQRLTTCSHQLKPQGNRDFMKYFEHYSTSEFLMREIEENDCKLNYLNILNQLTKAPEVAPEAFKERIREIKAEPSLHLILVLISRKTGNIVASGTVWIEQKFLRGLAKVGHIEDIVVDQNVRGKNLGRIIVEGLMRIAFQEEGVYKVILNCSNANIPFYEKLNYKLSGNNMAIYDEAWKEKYTPLK